MIRLAAFTLLAKASASPGCGRRQRPQAPQRPEASHKAQEIKQGKATEARAQERARRRRAGAQRRSAPKPPRRTRSMQLKKRTATHPHPGSTARPKVRPGLDPPVVAVLLAAQALAEASRACFISAKRLRHREASLALARLRAAAFFLVPLRFATTLRLAG